MDEYKLTRENYDQGKEWHKEKSLSYNWVPFIRKFAGILKGNKVLDMGCGNGRDIPEFINQGCQLEGVDFSEATIENCRASYPNVKFYVEDIRDLQLKDKYDGVWLCASLLNIKKHDIPRVLQEVRKVLLPGGHIFVSVKEGNGEKMVEDRAGTRFFSFFSMIEIQQFLQEAGFKIEFSKTITDEQLTGVQSEKPAWLCVYAKH